MLPQSWPTTSAEAIRPAEASVAPRLDAITGISGTTAPSPTENSRVGRYTIGPNFHSTSVARTLTPPR